MKIENCPSILFGTLSLSKGKLKIMADGLIDDPPVPQILRYLATGQASECTIESYRPTRLKDYIIWADNYEFPISKDKL